MEDRKDVKIAAKLYGSTKKGGPKGDEPYYKPSEYDTVHFYDVVQARTFCGKLVEAGKNGWVREDMLPSEVKRDVNCVRCDKGYIARATADLKPTIKLDDTEKKRRDELQAIEKGDLILLAVKVGAFPNTTKARAVRKDDLIKAIVKAEAA